MSSKRLVIMAGGTGGHIFPGLAVAEKYRSKGWDIHWIGTADRMEADIVPKHQIPIHFIEVQGVRGNGIKRLVKAPFMLLKSLWQARKILAQLKPDLVIGFGGYASGPGGIAAKALSIPLVIHEQNAVLGMTNKYLSKLANKTLLAFDLAKPYGDSEQWPVVGNPVRQEIVALNKKAKRPLAKDKSIRILVVGGSLGARILNTNLPAVFSKLAQQHKIKVQHQVGKGNFNTVNDVYLTECADTGLEFEVKEFIDNMTAALQQADLVICRAGALTVSELAASGNAGVFVPLPHAVDDHQTANANWLVQEQAGVLVPQSEITNRLPEVLAELLAEPEKINEMQQKAAQKANLTTADDIYRLCQTLEKTS